MPGLLVGVTEHDELEFRARVRAPAALGEPRKLGAQDLSRRGGDIAAVRPGEVRHTHDRALVPRDLAQRREIRAHLEVPVPSLPGGHLVAVDRCHVDVHRQQVVTALGAVVGDDSRKCFAVSRLPCSRPCMSVIASSTVSISPASRPRPQLIQIHETPFLPSAGCLHGTRPSEPVDEDVKVQQPRHKR